jgi:N-acetylmuramoyl-L-alanine amidase
MPEHIRRPTRRRSARLLTLFIPVLAVAGGAVAFSACSNSTPPPADGVINPGGPVCCAQDPHAHPAPLRTTTTTAALPLSGIVVGIDPGHNGGNFNDPSFLAQQVWNGREEEDCDTTGTEAADGYTEAEYNFTVASDLRADLHAAGATVVMTRNSNTGVGPCVNERAEILNNAHPSVAIDIHADGGPIDGRGFAVLEPVADSVNAGIIAPSEQFGNDLITAFEATGMPISTYDGTNGVSYRDDLAGLNLATEPKVLIECGNMKNATDAAMLESPSFQQSAAQAMFNAIATFLGRPQAVHG